MGLTLRSVTAQAQEKPNPLIVQCDHPTQRVVGTYGQTQSCILPIGKVASRGVIFSGACIGCSFSQPSRATLWSGMMPHQTSVHSNSSESINPRIPENVPTLGSSFSENGYEAIHFGKTHDIGSLRGFKHKESAAKPFTDPELPVNNDGFLDVGTYGDAVAYLSNPPEEPFICIADSQNPHNIYGFVGANEGVHIDRPISGALPKLPANFDAEDWSNIPKPVQYICCNHRRTAWASHWSEENYRHHIAAFRHYTKMVLKQVGSILKTLYSTPAGKGAIVIVMADHGGEIASHRMVTRHTSFYDEMTNAPFIFAGPGIKQQKKPIDQVLTQPTLDLLSTLYDLVGTFVPAEKPEISLTPISKGKKQKRTHPYIVSEWRSKYGYIVIPRHMVRGLRYKYTHYLEGNGERLYDMKKDPGKRKNLARDPKYSEVLVEHRVMLDGYVAHTKDGYRSLKVDADPRCRNHTPGYPNHEGPGAREILRRE